LSLCFEHSNRAPDTFLVPPPGLYNIETLGQRVALQAAFTMVYTVKDLAGTRGEKPFRWQGIDGAPRA
jgi:hypothetical protein